jgi:hypothetical protein
VNTASHHAKASSEQAIFRSFVELLGESSLWHAIESREPPEPDLLCRHETRGLVAFELVSITDPLIAEVNAGIARFGESSFSTSDPTERIIRKKLKRKYETVHPIELLVYNDLLVITPDDAIIETVLSWVGSLSHPFQQVWFMGEHHARSIWTAG